LRTFCLVGLILLGCVLRLEVISAQCLRFSKDVPCEAKAGPMNQLHFGIDKPAPQKLPSLQPATKHVAPANHAQPRIDCAMVTKPAPKFSSAMPVIQPDPKVKHVMRVTVVPPCKSS
jgi:hypothetical protein